MGSVTHVLINDPTQGYGILAETMLDTAAELGIETLEITTGGYSSAPHLDLDKLLSSADARREYLHAIESRGLKLETLNCNGDQLSPG